jgi:acetate kinase
MAGTPMHVLTINGGSSSVKFAVFACDADREPSRALGGALTGIGSAQATLTTDVAGRAETTALPGPSPTHADAAAHVLAWLEPRLDGRPLAAIAHRVVHGGERFQTATRLSRDVVDALRALVPLAPNHLPDEIALIEAIARARPDTPHVACFDTAFHHTLPAVSYTMPVPPTPGLRRYGFHGISFAYLVSALDSIAGPDAARGRVVLAHLGNGASLAAVRDGRCVDTTMGLTPAGGLTMSTRAGDLDPGVVIYLARQHGLTIDQLDEWLTQRSGLAAVSGGASDMRELLAREAADPRARLAVDLFCARVRQWIGAFSATLGGLDAIVFTAGIGERAPAVRARACEGLGFLGVEIDAAANASNAPVISTASSRVTVRVIPTDEALMMARETIALLAGKDRHVSHVPAS